MIGSTIMSAEEAVREVIGMYIESMEKSSGDMVSEAFHENAKVVGYLNGDFLQLTTADFAGFVSSQEPGNVDFEVLSCEVNGETATAKVRDKYLGISFLDSLSLINENGKWSIYNKLFHVEALFRLEFPRRNRSHRLTANPYSPRASCPFRSTVQLVDY